MYQSQAQKSTFLRSRKWAHPAVAAALMGVALGTSGCGSALLKLVQSVLMQTIFKNGNIFADIKSVLDLGKISLPNVTLPVLDGTNLGEILGQVILSKVGGKNQLGIELDLEKAIKTAAAAQDMHVLPNNTPLPVGGLDGVKVSAFPAGNKSWLYFAHDTGVSLIGTAIAIKDFEKLGKSTPQTNYFPSFKTKDGARGVIGIYTSANPGESGIAIFMDSSKIQTPPSTPTVTNTGGTFAAMSSFLGINNTGKNGKPLPSRLTFDSVKPGGSRENKIISEVSRLDGNRTKLTVDN